MKGLSKVALATLVIAIAFGMGIAAFAQNIPTQANIQSGGGSDAPIIKAKWETVEEAGDDLDDDPSKPWTQVNPPLKYQGKKTIKFWVIVADPNGFGDLTEHAYVDVYHPDGSFKYQVELTEAYDDCPGDWDAIQQAVADLEAAAAAGLVKFADGYDLDEVVDELLECSAKLYVGTAELDYHQMCGEFTWEYQCVGTPPDCTWQWTATDMTTGYMVDAYAFDKYYTESEHLVNYFEYICTAGIELDFDKINFGNVTVCSNKWLEGDWEFDATDPDLSDPACASDVSEERCRPPTVRNIGNIPVYIHIIFDDMGLGTTLTDQGEEYNVEWDARLGHGTAVYFNPYEEIELPEKLDLCNTQKISFSIHVKKATESGDYEGNVTIEPVPDPSYPYNP